MFLGQEVHFYMVYIEYYTELNLQIFNYAQKLTEICKAIFALAKRLLTFATVVMVRPVACHS